MRFRPRRIYRPADQRANPGADRRGSKIEWRPLVHLVAVDDEGMDEHGSAEPRADAGPDSRAVSRRVAGPLERLNGIERYGDISRAALLWSAPVDDSDVEIGIAEAHQPSRNRLSNRRDDGDEIAGGQLAPQLLKRCHARLRDAG